MSEPDVSENTARPGQSGRARGGAVPLRVVVLIAVAALAAGGLAGALLTPAPVPEGLAPAAESAVVPVVPREFTDRRQFTAAVTESDDHPLLAPRGGTLTVGACPAAAELSSGQTPFTVDDTPLLTLHTDRPLWRTLENGVRGEDVSAVQRELRRLGHDTAETGVFDAGTARAVEALWGAQGVRGRSTLDLEAVLWLPAATVPLATCAVAVGARVDTSTELATIRGTLSALTVTRPEGLPAGERVLVQGEARTALPADGRVTDPAFLEAVRAGTSGRTAAGSEPAPLNVTSELAVALTVAPVPASALFGLDGENACVSTGDEVRPVRILGSELGQSFILADPLPETVRVPAPGKARECASP